MASSGRTGKWKRGGNRSPGAATRFTDAVARVEARFLLNEPYDAANTNSPERPAWAVSGKTGSRQVYGSTRPPRSPLISRRALLGGVGLFVLGTAIGLFFRRWERLSAGSPSTAPIGQSAATPMPPAPQSAATVGSGPFAAEAPTTVTMADMPDASRVSIDLPMAEGAAPDVLGTPTTATRMVLPDQSVLAGRPAIDPATLDLPKVPTWLSSLGEAPVTAPFGDPPIPEHKPMEGHIIRAANAAPIPVTPAPTQAIRATLTPRVPATPRTPVWLANALNVPDPGRHPMVSIVIDDLGLDRGRTHQVLALPGPLTLSFMSYAQDLPAQTAAGHRAGHELMLHMPMQPQNAAINPGPGALMVGQSADEIRRRLDLALSRFTGYVGLNNHMGSRFTANKPGMAVVMTEVQRRKLLFLDSRTIGSSVAPGLAAKQGVPFLERSIFLDHTPTRATVDRQLAQLERAAKKHGHAIAIGHPRDATIAGLAAWLKPAQARGLALVPASAILRFARPA